MPLVLVMAVAAERLPLTTIKLMVSPDTGLLLRSLTVAWTVLVLTPSADRLSGVASTFTVLTGPAIKSSVVESFTPPEVAIMVAVPRFVELVMVTVATPFVVVAEAAEREPAVVAKLTGVPSAILFPLVSLTVAVSNVLEARSATILGQPAVTVTEPTAAAIMVMVSVPVVPFVDVAVTVSVPPGGNVFGAV